MRLLTFSAVGISWRLKQQLVYTLLSPPPPAMQPFLVFCLEKDLSVCITIATWHPSSTNPALIPHCFPDNSHLSCFSFYEHIMLRLAWPRTTATTYPLIRDQWWQFIENNQLHIWQPMHHHSWLIFFFYAYTHTHTNICTHTHTYTHTSFGKVSEKMFVGHNFFLLRPLWNREESLLLELKRLKRVSYLVWGILIDQKKAQNERK